MQSIMSQDFVSPDKKNKRLKKMSPIRSSKLFKESSQSIKVSPSMFLSEMSLSTEERLKSSSSLKVPEIIELLDISEHTHQKETVVDIEEPLFHSFPSEIVFQNFEPQQTCRAALRLQNNDHVARFVKVVQAESPYFTIISPPNASNKVAPGMERVFYIQFTPDIKKDYTHEVICITEREKFLIPIRAVGGRGILDFPDQLHFSNVPVKCESSKTILVRNIGNETARFSLTSDSPFSVSEEKGVLEVGESLQIHVSVLSDATGSYTGDLCVSYDTGEEVFVSLFADAEDINVRLDRTSIRLDNTYITNVTKRSLSIVNRSDVLVKFKWTPFSTAYEEQSEKQMCTYELTQNSIGDDEFLAECIFDPVLRDKFSQASRALKNQINVVCNDKMLYEDENIIIEPLEGEIWPNSSFDISVTFRPDEARQYTKTVYCDVSGRQARLPLKVCGAGVGPKISFSFDTLDIENVFINSNHSYEVVIVNKGEIDASFSYNPSTTLTGRQFTFSPTTGLVKAGEYQAVTIGFSSPHIGTFMESFYWSVDSSQNTFTFTIRGCVIGPTFHFDTPRLDFGTLSHGFTEERRCRLINTSSIPMTFKLYIPSDGGGRSAIESAQDFLDGTNTQEKSVMEIYPQEFTITPSTGVAAPLSDTEIQLTFTPLSAMPYETTLIVGVQGVGEKVLTLPISATSVIPTIEVATPVLAFGRCFIGHEYSASIQLLNQSPLLAKYEMISQGNGDKRLLTYSSPLPRGVINENSMLEIPFNFTLNTVQPTTTLIRIVIYGQSHQPLQVRLEGIGEGPTVHVERNAIDFGTISVLQDVSCTLQLTNESLIPAQFNCQLVRPNSSFSVQPRCAIICAESAVSLKITANVNDNARFEDSLNISVVNGGSYTVRLSATGHGPTIVSEPPFAPYWDVGAQFSNRVYSHRFRFYNRGRRSQQLYWFTEGFPLYRIKRRPGHKNTDDIRYKNLPPSPPPPEPIFKLKPDRLSLAPGRYQDVVLEAYSETAQRVSERLICQAIVGTSAGKLRMLAVDVTGNFIQPLLYFSEKTISFTVIWYPEVELTIETKQLSMKNISLLPLHCTINVQYPFQIAPLGEDLPAEQIQVTLSQDEVMDLIVHFDPNSKQDKFSWTIESELKVTYQDHPSTDSIKLKGEVFCPNLMFESDEVDFDAVLNDTEHTRTLKVSNISPVEVHYEWSFVNHNISFEGKDVDEGLGKELLESSGEDEEGESFDPPPTSTSALSVASSSVNTTTTEHMLSVSQLEALPVNVTVQEVFDILPLFGSLKPGESQQLQFGFYAHQFICAQATAMCRVTGGPAYKLQLKGAASLVKYSWSQTEIDVGNIQYNQEYSHQIHLRNDGKVPFDFQVAEEMEGVQILPKKGEVVAGNTVEFTITVLPSVPGELEKYAKIQVGHFPLEQVTVRGRGVYSRITVNLPRDTSTLLYQQLYAQAITNLGIEAPDSDETILNLVLPQIHEEMDRLEVKHFEEQRTSQMQLDSCATTITTSTKSSKSSKKSKRASLLEYVLDFGNVVYGTVATHQCQISNPGHFPASFKADQGSIHNTGFHVELNKVKGLPGFPYQESIEFEVSFNPQSAGLTTGPVEVLLPIKVVNGPTVNVCLRATVCVPDIGLSTDSIHFEEIVCGQCKVVTIQLNNFTTVPCEWEQCIINEENIKISKHVPLHMLKKLKKEERKPMIFELLPSSGVLLPGQRSNVQVKFMPTEQKTYTEKLQIKLCQSVRKPTLLCQGSGSEPRIDIDNPMLVFGPILPFCGKAEAMVKISNPCTYPVEFYSLEFDKQYVEEEKILRSLTDYDELNTTLLPPRACGEGLPKQLVESYQRQQKPATPSINASDTSQTTPTYDSADTPTTNVGDPEITPVSAAIASYLGIDLTSEGKAARNRRGICIVVHGSHMSGKTATAHQLADMYQAKVLSIDEVVIDAIKNGTSAAAQRVKDMCSLAGKQAQSTENAQESVGAVMTILPPKTGRHSSLAPSRSGKPALQPTPLESVVRVPLRNLNIDYEGTTYYNCEVPENTLVELLADRLQVSDCHVGVVFDGLESMFTQSITSSASAVLRAVNNRKHIYALTLLYSHEKLKQEQTRQQQEQETSREAAEQAMWEWIDSMSEEEYVSLTPQQQQEIDEKRLQVKRERMEAKQREAERRELELMEERKIEEEKNNKKNKKGGGAGVNAAKPVKKSLDKLPSTIKVEQQSTATTARPEAITVAANQPERPPSGTEEQKKTHKKKPESEAIQEEQELPEESEEEKQLKLKFKPFEVTIREVVRLFSSWDRVAGVFSDQEEGEGGKEIPVLPTASVVAQFKRAKNKQERKELKEIQESPAPSTNILEDIEQMVTEASARAKDVGLPNYLITQTTPQASLFHDVISLNKLPSAEEILEGLGLGRSGPPLPPDAVFSVVRRPAKRQVPVKEKYLFNFVPPTQEPETSAPAAAVEEKSTIEISEMAEKRDTRKLKGSKIDRSASVVRTTPKKGRPGSKAESPVAVVSPESMYSEHSAKSHESTPKHRWIVGAGETIELNIVFTTEQLGTFDKELTLELCGTLKKYKLFCRGVAMYPSICEDPRAVFANRKKFRKPEEIVNKKYITNSGIFEFGPLLAGKNRERYKEGRYPENMESLNITNNSQMHAEVQFSYLNDSNATTFLLDPSTMSLKPGERQKLVIWAFPKTPGFYEDTLVCCVKDNPNVVLFKLSTHGVRPELELDRKTLQFERVLLHRKETRTIYLRNSTLLPVAWKLNGMDTLGDDFSLSVSHGVIEPMSEFGLQLHFRAIKAVNVKKIVRLEVSDADNVMGLSHAENITVVAEGYDIALDMSFPKGTDGGLDFGTMRVGEENKLNISLKNKGRYEIMYSFVVENHPDVEARMEDVITITPSRGSLVPSDRPTQCIVLFRTYKELQIRDIPLVKCQIIEPNLGDGGELIAGIPVKVSAKSIYSNYNIFPVNDINFGAVLVSTKKCRTFVIENKCEFDFRFAISRPSFAPQTTNKPLKQNLLRTLSRQGSLYSDRSRVMQPQRSRKDSLKNAEMAAPPPFLTNTTTTTAGVGNNSRLNLGMFMVYPAGGSVVSGGSIIVNIDMISEVPMIGQEDFVIDISDRAPDDHPNGIEYRVIGETCQPSILSLANGIASIFEEHRIVDNLNVFTYHAKELPSGTGVYGEADNKLVIFNVIVGHKVTARIKITNPNKVPCDVSVLVRPLSNRNIHRITDIFDVEPNKIFVQAHTSEYVSISFQPASMQQYACIFEATVDSPVVTQTKLKSNLSFEIQGDGNLPRLSIVRPITTNAKGSPVIVFNRQLLGRAQLSKIALKNDGNLNCQAHISLLDPDQSYTVRLVTKDDEHLKLSTTGSKPCNAEIEIAVGDTAEFTVAFCPSRAGLLPAHCTVSVEDNPFENIPVELLGEGYVEDFTIDNIFNQQFTENIVEYDEATEMITVPPCNQIRFGDCEVGVAKKTLFTITNHSPTECMRFSWNAHPKVTFLPSCGHLQPDCSKDVSVTFNSLEEIALDCVNIPCHVTKIVLQSENTVSDWDNSKRVICWLDEQVEELSTNNTTTEDERKIPKKKKAVRTEEEPKHTVIPGSNLDVDLIVSANCHYAKYQLSTEVALFKETFMFQTRVYSFTMKNESTVALEYAWEIVSGFYRPASPNQTETITEPKGKNRMKKSATGKRTSSHLRQSSANSRKSEVGKREVRSMLASSHTENGRSASVMALVYEGGGCTPCGTTLPGVDNLPFTVEPRQGSIQAGEEQTFTVRFSPLDVLECNAVLTANVKNLWPGQERPMLGLHGTSLLPWCHFELEESDYIQTARNPELKGPNGSAPGSALDPTTKVVQFKTCGVNTKIKRKFFVVNPTDTAYTFEWVRDALCDMPLTPKFTCLTPKGSIQAGKNVEVVFEYNFEDLELRESFWRFTIDEHNISAPFLLVAHGKDPSLSFDRSHINFKQLLTGHTASEQVHLLNDEEQPFSFQFEEPSLHSAAHTASLSIKPMKGVVQANQKFPIEVSYKSTSESDVNFNVVCRIKKKNKPVILNVKAEGFSISLDLMCEDAQGKVTKLSPKGNNVVDFRHVELNEKQVRQLYIENNSRFNLDFSWYVNGSVPKSCADLHPVSVVPDTCSVGALTKRRCQLAFCPPCKMTLKQCTAVLKVANGPTYTLKVLGEGRPPTLTFSFTAHDFGACFIYRVGVPVQKKILTITNNDDKEISLECQYANTSYFEVHFQSTIIYPQETKQAEIFFYPREIVNYREKIVFEVNGLSTVNVSLTGQGTELKVEVLKDCDRKVNLGVLQIGEKLHRPVRLINNSLATLDFTCALPDALHLSGALTLTQQTPFKLAPKRTCDVIVNFQPKSRISSFSEEIMLEYSGVSQPLFTITGACHGMDLRLDSDAIPFGSVTLGSSSLRTLVLTNCGDIGTTFSWDLASFGDSFSISPHKGYISPAMEVAFHVTFTPKKESQDIRRDNIRCEFNSGKHLRLVLTGQCIQAMPMKELITFTTHVRNRDTKTITVHNRSNQVWHLKPVIDGEYWTGGDTFYVEAQQGRNYELTYRPLTMTHENKRHNGSVFFALPDGTGLLYNLLGTAEAPKPVSNVSRDVPCKVQCTELLNVTNWLRKPQRFRVTMELVKPEKPDPATTFKGLEHIDVPGLSKKEYKLHFYAHKEATFTSKVMFKNENSGEYQFYYVTFKVSSPGTIGIVELTTPVRQNVSHVITIANPLAHLVNFQTNCNIQDVNLPPQFIVPAQSEGSFTLECIPLKAGTVTGRLILQCLELGMYIYEVILTATPAAPERPVHFVASLGSNQTLACKFLSYTRTRAEYAIKVDSPEFFSDKTINAASSTGGGSEVSMDVTFEPSQLGNCKATLTLQSAVGGEYTFPLYGHCLPPKPQGPYTIKSNGSVQIPFKNIFAQATCYTFHVDHPSFSTKPKETIRPKKTHNIIVTYDGNQGESKQVRMGRLMVTCARSSGTGGNLSWIFYLKGVTP